MARNANEPIVVACLAAVDAMDQAVTHYFSDKGFVSDGASTPANYWMPPRLREAGGFSRRAFARGVSGRAESSYGRLVLENADGALNDLTGHAFDGRPVIVFKGKRGDSFPAGFTKVLVAQVKSVRLSRGQALEFTLGPALTALDKPPSDTRYLGDNVPPDGVEGTEADLKDKLKPLVFGTVRNAEPPLVNTTRNVYQASHGLASLDAIYSGGVVLVENTTHPTLADLMIAAAAGTGKYDVYAGPEGTFFRLGFNPSASLTFDATGDGGSSLRAVFISLAETAGIAAADVLQIDELSEAQAGLYVGTKETKLSALFDQLAASGGAAWWVDRLGKIRLFKLQEPGAPVWRVTETEALSASASLEGPTGGGIPAKGIDVAYAPIEETQGDGDLAESVSADRRAELKEAERHFIVEDAAVATRHLAADLLPVNTRLQQVTDATDLANDLQVLHGVLRIRASIEVSLDSGVPADLELGDTIAVTLPRLSLDETPMIIVGLDQRPAKNRLKLDLWA